MFWVLLLTCVVLYAMAILTTRLIGHGLILDESDLDRWEADVVQRDFGTMPESMFVLFKTMNGSFFSMNCLFQLVPLAKVAYVGFMIGAAWSILSILTAVL